MNITNLRTRTRLKCPDCQKRVYLIKGDKYINSVFCVFCGEIMEKEVASSNNGLPKRTR